MASKFRLVVWTFIVLTLSVTALIALTPTSKLFELITKVERQFSGLSSHTIKLEDVTIKYLRGGRGEPLIMLHGFGADKDNWTRIAKHLSKHYDVIALDIPGFGESTQTLALDYDVFSQVRRLESFANALNIEQFHLAGSSMGGYIAGNFAAKRAEKVKTLWLISPFGVMTAEPSEMFIAVKNGANPAVLPRNETEFSDLFDFLFVEPPFIPSPIVTHLAQKSAERVIINTKIFEQMHRMKDNRPYPDSPLEQALVDYKGKVLVTWGDKDRVLHVDGASVLSSILPQAAIDIMKDVGHLPMLEKPQSSAQTFIAFELGE